jgi:phosphoribosyl 1,2-cyclic phosphate phosphodiesterase
MPRRSQTFKFSAEFEATLVRILILIPITRQVGPINCSLTDPNLFGECIDFDSRDLREIGLAKIPVTKDITGKLILLGTGTSVGVPALGCGCAVCQGGHPKNQRTRASAILGLPDGNLLIDTSPDLRTQLLREGIGIVHSVIYTHEHTDHIMGFDDLRLFQFYLEGPVPIFCNDKVRIRLQDAFDYAFNDGPKTHKGATPSVDLNVIDHEPIELLGKEIIPIPLKHGPKFDVLGFRVGNVAYCTDVSEIPESSWELLQGLDTLVLDALRREPHVTHLSIDQAIEVSQKLGAKQTYFTHCACGVDYDDVNATLPAGIEVGYDGLQIELT